MFGLMRKANSLDGKRRGHRLRASGDSGWRAHPVFRHRHPKFGELRLGVRFCQSYQSLRAVAQTQGHVMGRLDRTCSNCRRKGFAQAHERNDPALHKPGGDVLWHQFRQSGHHGKRRVGLLPDGQSRLRGAVPVCRIRFGIVHDRKGHVDARSGHCGPGGRHRARVAPDICVIIQWVAQRDHGPERCAQLI